MPFKIAAMPAYNEAQAIEEVINGCMKFVDKVVVVDDGSTDTTAAIAESLGAYVVRHENNKGYGAALKNCFETARQLGADAMVILDSDGQHDPSDIPKLVEPLENGFDLVIGSRFVNGNGKDIPVYRKFGMKVLDIATYIVGGLNVTDSQSGFRAYGRRAIANINLSCTDMSAGSEILIHAFDHKLKFTEVEIFCRYDLNDCSSENPISHGSKVLLWTLREMKNRRPLYYFAPLWVIFFVVEFLVGSKLLPFFLLGEGWSFWLELLMSSLIIFLGTFTILRGLFSKLLKE